MFICKLFACICMYVCVYVRMYACMHVCMYALMYVCKHACMHDIACMSMGVFKGDVFTGSNPPEMNPLLLLKPKNA